MQIYPTSEDSILEIFVTQDDEEQYPVTVNGFEDDGLNTPTFSFGMDDHIIKVSLVDGEWVVFCDNPSLINPGTRAGTSLGNTSISSSSSFSGISGLIKL